MTFEFKYTWGIALFLLPVGILVASLTGSFSAGVGAAMLVWAAWNFPFCTLLGIVLLAPLSRSLRSDLIGPFQLAQIKTVLVLAAASVAYLRRRITADPVPMPPSFALVLLLWSILMALSCIHSLNAGVSLLYETSFLSGAALFVLTLQCKEQERRLLVTVILAIAGLIATLALLQFLACNFQMFPFLWKYILAPRQQFYVQSTFMNDLLIRASGTFTHPNQLGVFFALVIPVVFSLVGRQQATTAERCAASLFGCFLLVGLYSTNSRASILWTCISLLMLGMHKSHRWILVAMLIAMIAAGVFYVVETEVVSGYFEKVARLKTGLSSREHVWINVQDMIWRNPWLGVGPGMIYREYVHQFGFFVYDNRYELVDLLYSLQDTQANIVYKFYAHNLYLQMTAESGIFTPLLFLLGTGVVVAHCERLSRRENISALSRSLSVAVSSIAVGFVFFGFFDAQIVFTTLALNGFAVPLLTLGMSS